MHRLLDEEPGQGTNPHVVFWSALQQVYHINVLELMAISNALCSFDFKENSSILIRSDNKTTIAYINTFRRVKSPECHKVAKKIWLRCISRKQFLKASYISTSTNFIADGLSRDEIDQNDYELSPEIFTRICEAYGYPTVDCFATHLSTKCPTSHSEHPDPKTAQVDAFTVKWKDQFYAFPSFNLVLKTLRKVINDQVEGVIILPFWKG